MLDPGAPPSTCHPYLTSAKIAVTATFDGKTTRFAGPVARHPDLCDWPGGGARGVYWAATQDRPYQILGFARRLRCDEDRKLFEKPTPWALVDLCLHAPSNRAEALVRLAKEEVPPGAVFPRDPGSERGCWITVSYPSTYRITGWCSVFVNDTAPTPTVTFVERWPNGNETLEHTWRVAVNKYRAILIAETGPLPPQLWG
jgi:hypothetical protein